MPDILQLTNVTASFPVSVGKIWQLSQSRARKMYVVLVDKLLLVKLYNFFLLRSTRLCLIFLLNNWENHSCLTVSTPSGNDFCMTLWKSSFPLHLLLKHHEIYHVQATQHATLHAHRFIRVTQQATQWQLLLWESLLWIN